MGGYRGHGARFFDGADFDVEFHAKLADRLGEPLAVIFSCAFRDLEPVPAPALHRDRGRLRGLFFGPAVPTTATRLAESCDVFTTHVRVDFL